ncbi:chromosome segregation ATPase [Candidatus Scalindua japonica]|uniref:Chromosome segregation ATPase n=1 Tax=Candidatus Scalindua japonica TaxID=1284222 RepID=A0A286U3B7_9BACT|nr:hypothetical protein [Candidatus Scalindua japonica]GAX62619.1 chromosome segregation ATPase [Candidatus Scalindua japonica]
MKYFFAVCFFAIFLISTSTKSNSDEFKNPKSEIHVSFETLRTMIQSLDERISKLEEKSEKEEMQLQDPEAETTTTKNTMSEMNKRLAKVEKIIASIEMKEIEKALTSVENTLDILKKRLSENSKKLEDSEVHASVQEKMFRKILSDLKKQDTLTNRNDEKETVKTLDTKTKVLVKTSQEATITNSNDDQLQTIKKETDNIVKEKQTEVMKKPKESTELEGLKGLKDQDESGQLSGLKNQDVSGQLSGLKGTAKTTETTQLNKMEESTEIGNDFSVSNVTFEKFGSSSIVQGEIKNGSRDDIITVSFVMKLFGGDGNTIAEFDFNIMNIKSSSTEPFKEMVNGVLPSQISRYEIKYKRSR